MMAGPKVNDLERLSRTRLVGALELAVPQAIAYWSAFSDDRRRERLVELADVLAAHGDDLLYGGDRALDCFRALVDALALLALDRGSSEFLGVWFYARLR